MVSKRKEIAKASQEKYGKVKTSHKPCIWRKQIYVEERKSVLKVKQVDTYGLSPSTTNIKKRVAHEKRTASKADPYSLMPIRIHVKHASQG